MNRLGHLVGVAFAWMILAYEAVHLFEKHSNLDLFHIFCKNPRWNAFGECVYVGEASDGTTGVGGMEW